MDVCRPTFRGFARMGRRPTRKKGPEIDAVTGATPSGDVYSIDWQIPATKCLKSGPKETGHKKASHTLVAKKGVRAGEWKNTKTYYKRGRPNIRISWLYLARICFKTNPWG